MCIRDRYNSGIIKKHELTRADKEQDRINHVDFCNANTGPIFLTYKAMDDISRIIDDYTRSNVPIYDFTSEDGISHTVWKIDDGNVTQSLVYAFGKVPALYIADGHHRNASAAKVAMMRREENPDYTGDEEFNFYLAVIFPDDQLKILDYNRVVRDLNGMTKEEFLKKVSGAFNIQPAAGKDQAKPDHAASFGMYLDGDWYKLTPKEPVDDDSIKGLDVSILQDRLLTPVLGIGDVRTDDRIDFVGGIRGLGELERRVDDGWAVAFAMYPTSLQQLMRVADEGKIMPPKSTWFEPKLRSGLLIHTLD